MEKTKIETCVCSPGGHVSSIAIRYIDFSLRDGCKSVEYFSSNVRKTYGLEDKDDGKERVEHLMAIFASLVSKGVPTVDRLKKAEIQHDVHGSYVDLEPRGVDEGPKSPLDVQNCSVRPWSSQGGLDFLLRH